MFYATIDSLINENHYVQFDDISAAEAYIASSYNDVLILLKPAI